MKANLILFFFMISLATFAQEKYEYLGAIKLNGDAKSLISYRLVFTEKSGVIDGYSVTDLGGPHETKNVVKGTYDAKEKRITFREEQILYTKSAISDDMFCFINFTGKVKLINEKSVMDGDFKGLFKNKTKCIDGTLTLIGSERLYKLLEKVNKKIQKSKKVDQATKEKVNPIAILDSLKVNNLTKQQNLSLFTATGKMKLHIWDNGKEDGDVVSIYNGDTPILENYRITNAKKTIPVTVTKTSKFRVVAINEGTLSPNTAVLSITDEDHEFEVNCNLKKDEEAFLTIIKKTQ